MKPELIEIKQNWPGFDPFIGSWLCRGDPTLVLDVGPSASIRRLIDALETRGVEKVDYVLLSHIHIDHAGGLAEFLEHFPMAKAVCHTKGIKHLVEPTQLWEGSLKVLGEMAKGYGPIKPVSPDKILSHTETRIKGLQIIPTPGHAVHHLSYTYQGFLFSGEAAGNYFNIHSREYLRPAVPPPFFLDQSLESIRLLTALPDQPICYVHFGQAQSSHKMLHRIREQLMRWKDIIAHEQIAGNQDVEERCFNRLLAMDPELSAFQTLSAETRKREKTFIFNSIKGYLGQLI
jgi:glyoxylase-like metal-dependent hydrolase (beta-lactamase superfamily II)